MEPTALSVTLSTDELPRAQMTLTRGQDVRMHDLVEVFTADGSAGLFRVTDSQETFGETTTYTLTGALDTLSDDVYPGTEPITGAIPTIIVDILNKQSVERWQLGTCARTGTLKLSNTYSTLAELMEQIRGETPGYRWEFDYTTTPWTVSLKRLSDTVVSEFRLGRNVSGATVDISDAEMATRLYMTVSTDRASTMYTYDNLAAQATWGVIVKTIDVPAENAPDPAAYAAEILRERANPLAYITIEGEALRAITGDDFDRIVLGAKCRVVLDGYANAFEEVVTRVSWPDVLGEPERISVSLAHNLKPFSEQLKIIKRTGGGAARKTEEQERELVRHQAGIDQNNERILLWATEEEWDEIAQNYQLHGRSEYEQTWDEIALRVQIGDVATQLAVECGNVTITGGNLVVDGYVTASAFDGLEARFDNLVSGTTMATTIWANTLSAHNSLSLGQQGTLTLWGTRCAMLSKTVMTGVTVTFPTVHLTTSRYWVYAQNNDLTNLQTTTGRHVSSVDAGSVDPSTATLHYVGYT